MASISGGIMGDEYIESYYFCKSCGVYTLEVYHDRFLGEEDVSVRGPLPKAQGDAKVELIRQCSQRVATTNRRFDSSWVLLRLSRRGNS